MDYGIHGIPRSMLLSDPSLRLIKKHLLAVFINDGTEAEPKWVRIENTAEFSRELNPVTEDRDYIADEHPTTEVLDYKPSEGITLAMYAGSPDFDFMYKKYKTLATGGAAHNQILRLSLFDGQEVTADTVYYAEVNDATIVINTANFSDSQLTCTIYENGSTTAGFAKVVDKKPVFTAGDFPQAAAKPVFNASIADASYTVNDTAAVLDGTAKVTDGGVITYSWKKANGEEVATTASFTPPTDTVGNETYTVTATNTLTTGAAATSSISTMSANIEVKALIVTAAKPVFNASIADASYTLNDTAAALDGTATAADGGTITYSWAKADGTVVGTDAAYTPATDTAGSETYTVTATNTLATGETATESMSAAITVSA